MTWDVIGRASAAPRRDAATTPQGGVTGDLTLEGGLTCNADPGTGGVPVSEKITLFEISAIRS